MSGFSTCAKMLVRQSSICFSRPFTTASGSSQLLGRLSCGLPTTHRTLRGFGASTVSTRTSRIATSILCHFAMNSTRTVLQSPGTANVSSNTRTFPLSVYRMKSRW